MAFDVTGLTGYVDESRNELISAAVAGAKSAQILPIQTGIKSSATINILDTDVAFQANSGIGRTPNMTTTISQRNLAVAAIKVEENLDVKVLEDTYIQHQLKMGSKQDAVPFEQAWADLKARKIADALEQAIWKGEVGGAGGANLTQFDGFLEIIKDDAGTNVVEVDGNAEDATAFPTASAITKDNIIAAVDLVYENMPSQLLGEDDLAIFMGKDNFRLLIQALREKNYYHYSADNTDMEFVLPGTNVKIIALDGLNAVSTASYPIVGGRISNFVVGVDLEHDEEHFDLWYSMEDKCLKFDSAFKYGVQIAFLEEVVAFTVAQI